MPPAPLVAPALPHAGRNSSSAAALPRVESIAALGLQLSRHQARCRRAGEQMAMLWIEVEPLAGPGVACDWDRDDELLQAAGLRLRHRVRSTDEVVQVGTQGFAVLLPGTGAAEAELVEQRLKQALTGAYGLDERRMYLGVSVGRAMFPEAGRNGTELAEAACRDLALRQGG